MTEGAAGRRPALWIMALGGGLLALRAFVLEPVLVRSANMAPGLVEGDLVLVRKTGAARPGDVVLVEPVGDGDRHLERVIAGEGEVVELVRGRLYVDGEALGEEDSHLLHYASGCERTQAAARLERRGDRSWTVLPGLAEQPAVALGPGELWVLGDHRVRSHDSRHWGALTADQVVGVVVARLGSTLRCP